MSNDESKVRDGRLKLFTLLLRELVQAERSCKMHCPREAARLGMTEPAEALREIAVHAVDLSPGLREITERERGSRRELAELVGTAFSDVREVVVDRIMREERSYRGTLLGIRHGVDVARLLGAVAQSLGRQDVVELCQELLAKREPLLERATLATAWFVDHPERALSRGAAHRQAL